MSWHAINSIDEAITGTRSFLSPASVRRWAPLALVSVFVGAGGGSVTGILNLGSSILPDGTVDDAPTDASGTGDVTTGVSTAGELRPAELVEVAPAEPTVVLVGVAALIGIGLAVSLVSNVLQFVFYDALRTGRVAVVEPATRRFGQALRLLGFTLALQVVTVAPFVAVGAAVVADVGIPIGPGVVVAGGVFFGLLLLGSTLAARITDEFVVPTMVITDAGVLDAWRRFWPVLRGQLPQFGVYLAVHFVLLLVIGLVRRIVATIVYLTLIVAAGAVGLGIAVVVFGSLSAAAASTPALVLVGVVALLALLVGWVLLLPVRVVVLSYVTTYEVSVLAAADDDLRLRPRDADPDGTAAVE